MEMLATAESMALSRSCLPFVWKWSAAGLKLLPVLVDELAGMELSGKGRDHIRGRELRLGRASPWELREH